MTIRSKRTYIAAEAFMLAELMITVVVIGILAAVTISLTGSEWRRERINTLAIDLAGWLEVIRNNSLKQTSSATTSGGCTVTFSALTAQAPGSILASVSPSNCAPESNFRIPGITGNHAFSTAITNGGGAGSNQIIFTPRGTSMNTQPIDLNMRLDGSTSLRCVRVSANLGLISIGNSESASGALASATCTSFAVF